MITWKRREFTTRGSDPTVVVEWVMTNAINAVTLTVTEFQGVYITSIDGQRVVDSMNYWEERHRALEATHGGEQ